VSESETESPYKVQVLDRAFAILDVLASSGQYACLGEHAETLALNKSTVHRLLMILEGYRAVQRDPQTGRYQLGLRLFELGSLAVGIQYSRTRLPSYTNYPSSDYNESRQGRFLRVEFTRVRGGGRVRSEYGPAPISKLARLQ